jgi:23S rRNA G2069 N7-methylase RlmK/C1962 C5-methylase RlmI
MLRLWRSGQLGALVACATLGFVVGVLGIAGTHAGVLAQAAPHAPAEAQAAADARVFGSDAGLVLNFIKPDKAGDFEAVVARLKEALQKSDKPERKQQAATWRVFRAVAPGTNGAILYIFDIDPAVHGADYTVSTILSETFPNEAQDLYRRYADAYASGQTVVDLKLVSALGQ